MTGFTDADVSDQSGKCFIVTGANTGIGFEVSRVLASRGARVLLACRDKAKADRAITRIRQGIPEADLAFLPLDQADLENVRTAAETAMKEPRIDVLINNAGVLSPLQQTKQGHELQFGVNYLGVFALTALLLPKLAETVGSRVVLTGSLTHQNGKIDWNDLNATKSFEMMQRYADSKLAILLFLFELDRRLRAAGSPVMAVGCHPGAAVTDVARHLGLMRVLMPLLKPMLNSAAMGAWPALQAACGSVQAGGYYGPTRMGGRRGPSGEASPARQSQDPELARRLWEVSIAETGIDPGFPPLE